MTDLSRLAQLNSELDYRRAYSKIQSMSNQQSITGLASGWDGLTGQQKILLPNGGSIRATSLSPSGYKFGSVIPSVVLGTQSGFVDAR